MRLRVWMLGLIVVVSGSGWGQAAAKRDRAAQVRAENQPVADLGNGWYRNPVLPGGWGDTTVVKVKKDYYLAHSPGNGVMIWHSRDLVNWRPVARHTLSKEFQTIWAIDIVHFNGKFHIYMPIGTYPGKTETEKQHQYFKAVWVISAEKPEGPWSDPVRVDRHYNPDPFYTGIDPGFIQTPEGEKFLYVDNGFMMPMTDDGLASTAMPKVAHKGWDYPREWVVQGRCLESPKLFYKDGYYYMTNAMGGTSGPTTAHMTTVSRARHPAGPWEDSPYNPLVHTYTEGDPWWHQGHGTIIEGPKGDWWTMYPSRPRNYNGMGKQDMLLPVEWTSDGWPRIRAQYRAEDLILKPKGGENVGHGMPLSDEFTTQTLGLQWNYNRTQPERYHCGGGKLVLDAKGTGSRDGTMLGINAVNKSYEVTVEVACPQGVTAGLVFGNNEGLKIDGEAIRYNQGGAWRTRDSAVSIKPDQKVFLKVRNYRQDLSFFASLDGEHWIHFQNGARSGQYSVKLFAAGEGQATFRDFRYLGIEGF